MASLSTVTRPWQLLGAFFVVHWKQLGASKSMSTKKKIVWRLKEQPTADALRELVKDQILSKDEAREILLSQEEQEDRDKKSLESEIKFLRELVAQLSERSQIVKQVEIIEHRYDKYPWFQPYAVWCYAGNSASAGPTYTLSAAATGSSTMVATVNYSDAGFDKIKTFG